MSTVNSVYDHHWAKILGDIVQILVVEVRGKARMEILIQTERMMRRALSASEVLTPAQAEASFVEYQSCHEFGHAAVCYGVHEHLEKWLVVYADGRVEK